MMLALKPIGVWPQVALDEYEKGFTSARMDEVFSQVSPCLTIALP